MNCVLRRCSQTRPLLDRGRNRIRSTGQHGVHGHHDDDPAAPGGAGWRGAQGPLCCCGLKAIALAPAGALALGQQQPPPGQRPDCTRANPVLPPALPCSPGRHVQVARPRARNPLRHRQARPVRVPLQARTGGKEARERGKGPGSRCAAAHLPPPPAAPTARPLPQKVKAMFLVSGWTRDAAPRHVVRVVEGPAYDDAKAALGLITALHVYSLQPALLKVSGGGTRQADGQAGRQQLGWSRPGEGRSQGSLADPGVALLAALTPARPAALNPRAPPHPPPRRTSLRCTPPTMPRARRSSRSSWRAGTRGPTRWAATA